MSDKFAEAVKAAEVKMVYRVLGVIVIGMGLLGLNAHVEYSGWVLFIGILMVM